jgi:hypothetical protein
MPHIFTSANSAEKHRVLAEAYLAEAEKDWEDGKNAGAEFTYELIRTFHASLQTKLLFSQAHTQLADLYKP